MTVEAAKPRSRTSSVVLDDDRDAIIDALAAHLEGSRSEAFRHLIDLYAGSVMEEIREAHPDWEIPRWSRRRLSFELANVVARLRRAGNTRNDSFTMAGVSANQAKRWIVQGKADVNAGKPSVYADFAMGLELAEAELKREELEKARAAGDYKFVLSRQFPDDYAERKRTDSTVTHQFNLVIDWEALTLAEARTLVALLRKGSPGADGHALGRHDRPALDAVPPEIMAATIEDAEYEELDDESPGTSEAPLALEAPAAEGVDQKPQD